MKKKFGKISFIILDVFVLGFFGFYLAMNLTSKGNDEGYEIKTLLVGNNTTNGGSSGGSSSGSGSGSTSGPSAPCCENGTRTITDSYGCNQCRSCTAGACPEPQPTTTTCSAGNYYAGQGKCSGCPANYWCPGGTFSNSDSSRDGINACPSGTESRAGSSSESDCKTTSDTITCAAGKYYAGQGSCSGCPANYWCPGGTFHASDSSRAGINACPSGTKSAAGSTSASDCHAETSDKCPAGQAKDSSASSGCSNCAAGYYRKATDDDTNCTKCPSGQFSSPGSSSCQDLTAPCCVKNSTGSRTTIDDTNGCKYALAQGASMMPGACPIADKQIVSRVTVSPSTTVYVNPSQESMYGAGYATLTYVAYDQNGDVMKAENVSWSNSGGAVVASASASGGGYTVLVKGLGCDKPSGTVTATASGKGEHGSGSATSPSVTVVTKYTTWSDPKSPNWNKPKPEGREIIQEAWRTSYCDSYSGYDPATGTYKYQHWRCCGTPTETETDKCYKNKATGLFVCGKYASDTTHYTYIADDCNSDACKNPTTPTPACYKNASTGEYAYKVKSELTNPDQWVYVDVDEANCKPTEDKTPACYYQEGTGKYFWGYYEDVVGYVSTTLPKEECKNPEPACYKDEDGGYVWGDYKDITGYTVVASITDKDKCKVACFKCTGTSDKDIEYIWGGYDENTDCEVVPSITTADSCKYVPPTGATVSKIIYALSLFLVMAGSGIVVYQLTKTKKELN